MSPAISEPVEVYILQEAIPKEIATEIRVLLKRTERPLPRTAAVLADKYDWIKHFSVEHLLGQTDEDIKQILHVPENAVRKWGLREGDRVRFNPKRGFDEIYDVNGFGDPEAVRERPKLIGSIRPTYAQRRLAVETMPIDQLNGNKSLRALSIIAPPGYGQRLLIPAPPEAGKSWLVRYLYESVLKLMEYNKKLFVIMIQVGERPEDATEFELIRQRVKHDQSRSEIYLAPAGDPEEEPREGHYWLTRWVKKRAERLCEGTKEFGYDVVLFIDSISRIQMSHSFSAKIEKPRELGLLSQGLSTASLMATTDLLPVAGDFDDRSLTIVSTMLKDELNPKKRKRSAETVLYDQSGPSIASATWGLANLQDEGLRPWIDLSITRTREFHRICTRGQLEERKHVNNLMWRSAYASDGSFLSTAENALRNLLKYAEGFPTFESSQFASYDLEPVIKGG